MTVFSAQGNGFYKLNSPFFIPVELSAFSASVENGSVLLSWSTASELNNNGFEIERASSFNTQLSNGTSPLQEWEKIGFVEGHGTTTEKQNYNFNDKPTEYGTYLYRLKQIDFDGTFEYSNAAEVEFSAPSDFILNQNYPNPFNPTTVISFQLPLNSQVSLRVYDLLGNEIAELVNEFKPAGLHKIEFNSEGLSSGIYFYKITAGEFLQIRKMSLIK